MAGDAITWGIISSANIAQKALIPAIDAAGNAELAMLGTRHGDRVAAVREQYEFALAPSYDAVLASDVDAVYIPLPNGMHADWAIRALEAGKHVLCEKPLAISPEEVADIVAAAERNARTLLVGMNNRYRDDSILLKNFLEDGALGEVVYARAGWFKRRDRIRRDHWHYRLATSGGGVFMDLGIQILDLALWMCSYPEPERVSATFYHHFPEIEVEDSAIVTLMCAGGLSIALETSWHFIRDSEHIALGLFGSGGSGFLSPIRIYQHLHGNLINTTPKGQRRVGNLYMESYEREIAFFAEVVAGREEAPPLAEHLALSRAVAAIRRSADEGREVVLSAPARAAP
ncbi:MAG TPA: Gfo/Idh/MocA family oxidoreductase [Gemmatimonadota bacterium]|nr:Gfo/Idh/MocA family oxidoreductase [Gemmatimonadota bacterium]